MSTSNVTETAAKAGFFGKIWGYVKGSGKWGAIAGVATAVVGGGLYWLGTRRGEAQKETAQLLQEQAVNAAYLPSGDPNTIAGVPTVRDGYWAQTVRPQGQQTGINASQPNLNIGGSVQQLGS